MATAAQVEANRRNALRSTGPTSPEGKAVSCGNSRKHGLAASSTDGELIHPQFESRLREWRESIEPETPEARFALQQAVAATFRLEACGAAFTAAVAGQKRRARLTWKEDRIAEAAALFARLDRMPEAIAPRLKTSAQGVELMLRAWKRLEKALEAKEGAWNEAEVATACDLLGIPRHLRDGRLPIDPRDPSADLRAYRARFVEKECGRLEEMLIRHLRPLDRAERRDAEQGTTALATPAVRLVLRYEAATRRWFERMLALARSTSPAEDRAVARVLAELESVPEDGWPEDDDEFDDLDAGPAEPAPVVNVGPIDDRPPLRPRPRAPREMLDEMGSPPDGDEAEPRSEVEVPMGTLSRMLEDHVADASPDEADDRLAAPRPAPAPASPSRPNRHTRRARAAMARAGT